MESEMPKPTTTGTAAVVAAAVGCDASPGLNLSDLRGVIWRIHLGILPSPDSSIEVLRRGAADSRRKYASLRRRHLVDPHLSEDGRRSFDLLMDNPLSQNPDSMWGRFFRNAELEKMLDKDLSRLYPEHGDYFQTSACQTMLRRILLLWCLRHPEYGYRQGMHELLAPLLYVLHVDIQRLSEVRRTHEHYFTDEFDGRSFPESDVVSSFDEKSTKVSGLDELDSITRNIILLSDAYGAEGELGVVLSERFMEHDAYCLFDSLMNGSQGVVAMAEFFSPSMRTVSKISTLPVIEASNAVYHLLSIVDPSLQSHLVELGVEPQYFYLRWLRVLFGREFTLQNLLVIWDEVFSSQNRNCYIDTEENMHPHFKVLSSARGAFVTAMAVSMILHIRSSLLASEHATSCLQKLLNFPENIDVKKLIEKARTLQSLVLSSGDDITSRNNKPSPIRSSNIQFHSVSPVAPVIPLTQSYWEEQWRVLHITEELRKGKQNDSISKRANGGPSGEKLQLSRTESYPSPSRNFTRDKSRSIVRRSLLEDFSKESEAMVHPEESGQGVLDSDTDQLPVLNLNVENDFSDESNGENLLDNNFKHKTIETCLSGENSSELSAGSSPHSIINHHESYTEKSSVASNSCAGGDQGFFTSEVTQNDRESLAIPDDFVNEPNVTTNHPVALREVNVQEKKPAPTKFQWFWNFRKSNGEGSSSKVGKEDLQSSTTPGNVNTDISSCLTVDGCGASGKVEAGDKKVFGTLRNLGQSMLENIQVIETAFQQEKSQAGSLESISNNILGGKGQATALAAIKQLRKISNLLSEM